MKEISTPYYIVYEDRLRRNFELITEVGRRSGAKIIVAFKANALWRTFDILRQYTRNCTASSVNELLLGAEKLSGEIHSYTPAYSDSNIDIFTARSTHMSFNSLSQWQRYGARALAAGVSCGLRVNPKCTVIETDIYNPALPGSRFGVEAEQLVGGLPAGIEGLHFHALCESSADDLAKVLEAFESQFGHLLPTVKWVNMGGGHLITRQGYDTERLVEIIRGFRSRHPGVEVILEPGSAWMWCTGDLEASVVDTVCSDGINTAILDVSFACHMPDTLEMPYTPRVLQACQDPDRGEPWRLGGCSCLSGDFKEGYRFERPLRIGDRITLCDMNHYTTVKTTMFNGVAHPDIVLRLSDGTDKVLRHFTHQDYLDRMS